jgi:thiamine pyrophosphate-dependent acetolactate synthase large subunit-like protein
MYAIQGLWTAAQLGLPISFIIINNNRYEALLSFCRHFGMNKAVGTELPGIDFVGLAEAQGIGAERVENAETLDAALRRSLASAAPSLVEVMVAQACLPAARSGEGRGFAREGVQITLDGRLRRERLVRRRPKTGRPRR